MNFLGENAVMHRQVGVALKSAEGESGTRDCTVVMENPKEGRKRLRVCLSRDFAEGMEGP